MFRKKKCIEIIKVKHELPLLKILNIVLLANSLTIFVFFYTLNLDREVVINLVHAVWPLID